ncbi:MAG: hypothetical protein Q8R76_13100 [Candidatus Omnitrophota bacterium]|nr:hypothetical protein [Candidatus Omnitrophota bacterium]
MLNEICQFRAKNQAAYDFIREVLTQTVRAGRLEKEAMEKVMRYMIGEGEKKGYEAVDLNELFRFILYDQYVLVIPKARFGENDFLILKNLHPEAKLNAELIEFNPKGFEVNPIVYFPGYLRRCLKRGLHDGSQ